MQLWVLRYYDLEGNMTRLEDGVTRDTDVDSYAVLEFFDDEYKFKQRVQYLKQRIEDTKYSWQERPPESDLNFDEEKDTIIIQYRRHEQLVQKLNKLNVSDWSTIQKQ